MKELGMERYQTVLKKEMSLAITFVVTFVARPTRPNRGETGM